MEEIIFQIYGTLILTFTGFVLPILAIALSLFPEGVKVLKQTYENEQKQAEDNLKNELQKKSEDRVDLDSLSKNINTLKLTKKRAGRKLFYLNPQNIISKSLIALGVSLVSFLVGLFFYMNIWIIPCTLFLISIGCFIWAMIIFANSISIIIEASSTVQGIQRKTEEKTLELLATLVDNSKNNDKSTFINHNQIKVFFKSEEVVTDKEYSFSVNNKHTIKISLKNLSEYMLKTAQLGFTFPAECIIDERDNLSIYTGEKEKIIRFNHEHLQSNEHMMEGDINITFLKVGEFNIDTFTKGENLKNKNIKFKIKVVE